MHCQSGISDAVHFLEFSVLTTPTQNHKINLFLPLLGIQGVCSGVPGFPLTPGIGTNKRLKAIIKGSIMVLYTIQ